MMTETATILLYCDSRSSLSASPNQNSLPDDSVVALPLKREALRKLAKDRDFAINGEVILEIEKGSDLQSLLDSALQKTNDLKNRVVLCADRQGLEQAGLFSVLQKRLQQNGHTLIEY